VVTFGTEALMVNAPNGKALAGIHYFVNVNGFSFNWVALIVTAALFIIMRTKKVNPVWCILGAGIFGAVFMR
jgi:chromate transport protein ChrA